MSATVEIKSERIGYCRICQCYEDENMFDMLEGLKEVLGNEDDMQTICESFIRKTGIQVSPDNDLSRFVCADCFTRLKNFLFLRQQAKDSHRKLTETTEFQCSSSIENNSGPIIKLEKEEIQPQCLICMGYDDEMSDIFSDITFELDVDLEKNLNHIFEEIVGISPSDYAKSDKLLCGGCVNRLIESGTFRHQALKTDESSTEESLAEDMIEIKQENFHCQLCLRAFADQLDYETHLPCINQTTTDRPYQCKVCGKSFIQNCKLQKHMFVHSNERSYLCNVCSKTFKYQYYHLRVHSEKRPYGCKLCLKTFKMPNALTKHFRTHDDKKEFVCHICSKGFKEFWNLKEHARVHSTDRPFVCKVCFKSFKRSSNLTDHMNIHEVNRPHPCSSCSKTFTNSRTLKKHLSVHNQDRPFVCEICSKSFKHAKNLSSHKMNHTNERSYKCKFCPEIFTDERNLNIHVQVHTPNRKFICSICSKNFSRSCDLSAHLRVHSDKRPFSCDSCSKSFKKSSDLTRHQNTHKKNW